MFEALIRRKNGAKRCTVDEYADESTLFSLTTEVPRPSERRTEERLQTILPVAKLVTEALEALCRIKNISAGGLMAEVTAPVSVGTELYIEMNPDQRIPGRVVWARDGAIGVKFDQDVDLRELLANRRPREGFRPRPPRSKSRAAPRCASASSTTRWRCATSRKAESRWPSTTGSARART
jgi:hypothetical protein